MLLYLVFILCSYQYLYTSLDTNISRPVGTSMLTAGKDSVQACCEVGTAGVPVTAALTTMGLVLPPALLVAKYPGSWNTPARGSCMCTYMLSKSQRACLHAASEAAPQQSSEKCTSKMVVKRDQSVHIVEFCVGKQTS